MEERIELDSRATPEDLLNCDREPVHVPGAVQSHAYFVAIRPDTGAICALSRNLARMLDTEPETLIGALPEALFGVKFSRQIDRILRGAPLAPFETNFAGRRFLTHCYWTEGVLVCEHEPRLEARRESLDVRQFFQSSRDLTLDAQSHETLLGAAADFVRAALRFDRVMVYQFDPRFNGRVVAESKHKRVASSFLGLNFPASDIPPKARELFARNRVRSIANVIDDVSDIVPRINPLSNTDFDLSDSQIRAVSPIHIEYLANMGVHSSMTIALGPADALWGLIACHNYEAKAICPYSKLRLLVLAEALHDKLRRLEMQASENSRYEKMQKLNRFLRLFRANTHATEDSLLSLICSEIASLLEADYVFLAAHGAMHATGPLQDGDLRTAILSAEQLMQDQAERGVACTDDLTEWGLERRADLGGVLVTPPTTLGCRLIVGRKPTPRRTTWAGDPSLKVLARPDESRLHPRRSFELYEEVRRDCCAPWDPVLSDIAGEVLTTASEIIAAASTDRERRRNEELLRNIAEEKTRLAETTQREKAEIERLQQRFKFAKEAASIGVWDYNVDEQTLYWSDTMFDLFNVSKETFSGSLDDWSRTVLPTDLERVTDKLLTLIETGEPFEDQFTIQYTEAETREIKVFAKRFEIDGRVHVIGVNLDISRETKMMTELRLRTQEAQRASRLKSEFVANMSHEIRTPLNGILGMTQFLQRTELNERQETCLSTIQECGDSLLSLVTNIIDISKIESGVLTLAPSHFDLAQLIGSVARSFQAEVDKAEISLRERCDLGSDREIFADEQRMRQIIVNLVGNAIKFTERGGMVTIEARREADGRLRLAVIDTGLGVSEEKQAVIFERFRQADGSNTRERDGAGLGLAITKELVELMGGEIGVDSVLGQGSTFWVCIPPAPQQQMQEGADLNTAAATQGETASSSTGRLTGQRILIAEDCHINQAVVAAALDLEPGIERDFVENGREAVEAVATGRYDLVLMDINMPVMNGLEAIKAIRAGDPNYRSIPIIVCSANAYAEDRLRYLDVGANDFIAKPYNLDELLSVVKRVVRPESISGSFRSHQTRS